MELFGDETECGEMNCEMEEKLRKVVAMANEMHKGQKFLGGKGGEEGKGTKE